MSISIYTYDIIFTTVTLPSHTSFHITFPHTSLPHFHPTGFHTRISETDLLHFTSSPVLSILLKMATIFFFFVANKAVLYIHTIFCLSIHWWLCRLISHLFIVNRALKSMGVFSVLPLTWIFWHICQEKHRQTLFYSWLLKKPQHWSSK